MVTLRNVVVSLSFLLLTCHALGALITEDVSKRGEARTVLGTPPTSYGMIVFPAFQALDVFGPLDVLNILSLNHKLDLAIISANLSPVSTAPRSAAMNPFNSTMSQAIVPTHTFQTAPKDLEVLIVPGGLGTRAPIAELQPILDFITTTYPGLKYLITICTGSGVVARTGILDGKRATTNKASWNSTVALGPNVKWVGKARWMVDGNIWTSSGISAGIDAMLAWVGRVYGQDKAETVSRSMEYERATDWRDDPWWEVYH